MEISLIYFLYFLLPCFFIFISFTAVKSRRNSGAGAGLILPPGPPKIPFIGNILRIGKNPHHTLSDLSKTYGPVMSLKLGSLTTVVITSPEAAKEVLQTQDHVLSGRTVSDSVRFIGHHDVSVVWLPANPRWRLLRKLTTTQLFLPQRLDLYTPLRITKVKQLLNFINKNCGIKINIARATFVTFLNIISNILFSVDFGSYDDSKTSNVNVNEYHDIVVRIMKVAGTPNVADFFPFLGFLDLQSCRQEMKTCTDRLFQVFQEIIDSRFEIGHGFGKDVLDSLLDIIKEKDSELGVKDIKHLLLDFFIAGTDTSSSTVEWAMTELLNKPETMTKVQCEIRQVIGQNDDVQESHLLNLPYLNAVVKETLRLHPPVPFLLPHRAEADARVAAFLVPKNAQVLVNIWAIGRDPKVWENPMKFEPERFLWREIDMKGKDFELTPFGSGRRVCPGMSLALRAVPLVLASLLHSFDWKLQNGVVSVDMEESFGVTLHKANPLYAVAVPIKKHV